jgi:hypothetical protein
LRLIFNQSNACPGALNFLKPGTTNGFKYCYVGGPNNARALFEYYSPTEESPGVWEEYVTNHWADIEGGALAAVVNYAYSLARTRRSTPIGEMPSRRTIYARAVWDYAPVSPHIYSVPLGEGRFLVDTLTLKIDIMNKD